MPQQIIILQLHIQLTKSERDPSSRHLWNKSKIDYYLSYWQYSEPLTYTFVVCHIQGRVTDQNNIIFSDYLFRISLKVYKCTTQAILKQVYISTAVLQRIK